MSAEAEQTGAEFVAERADYYRTARRLVTEHDWPDGYGPADVLELAAYLSGDYT
ncbi:hypothetical protein ACFXOY_31200 [Streptomyces niveus]|uniref:hypothetical protein n=1 Tax=Streptomyces niveus TaxID=193462 RepID=UPI0036A1A3ED